MPDITMCRGEGCLHKLNCFRHVAKPSMMQSIFVNPPFEKENPNICKYFWQVSSSDDIEKLSKAME